MGGGGEISMGLLSPPQRPEQLAQEIGALDSSKEQLLKEGENGGALPCPALPCSSACSSAPSCCREAGRSKAGGCEESPVLPVWYQGLLCHHRGALPPQQGGSSCGVRQGPGGGRAEGGSYQH